MLISCQPCDGIIPWTSANCCVLLLLWHQRSVVLNDTSVAEQAWAGKPTSPQQIIFPWERSGYSVKAGWVLFKAMSFSELCYFHTRETTADDPSVFLTHLHQYGQQVIQTCGAGGLWDKVCSTEMTVECESTNPQIKSLWASCCLQLQHCSSLPTALQSSADW